MKLSYCQQGKDIAEARNFAMSIAKEKEMTYINGYDHPHIIGKFRCAEHNL